MKSFYSSPLRVYLSLALLALAGIYSGFKLPISLFPNSSKPEIGVSISYGSSTAEDFLNTYGKTLESRLRSITGDDGSPLEVEQITARYANDSVSYTLGFKWGSPAKAALREVESVVRAFAASFPRDVRDSVDVWTRGQNSGFLAVSFYSSTRSLDELYKILEPLIVPRISKVQDARDPALYNPSRKEISIQPDPGTMAALQLFPRQLEQALTTSLTAYTAGSITLGTRALNVTMPRETLTVDDIRRVQIPTPGGRAVHLGEIARVDLAPATTATQSFKTNGLPSLILWASPKPGGNVKRMAEEMIAIVKEVAPSFPKDVQYRILVDPSEFIRESVHNVFREVAIGALLAVLVLFLFIGSLRNTITAAIEIPLSMVLAFILMRMSGMNLNLISLGGLALSAGMNVDASVVVMENIFRHFDSHAGKVLNLREKLRIITRSVSEVRFSVIASTVASLVVFLPLAFTSDLTYAILGDLAKTVVFSHGFSALVALVLVPTVRLHLMSRPGAEKVAHPHAPLERPLKRLENAYARALGWFINSRRFRLASYGAIIASIALLATFVIPKLPRELIGTPDTDWMLLGFNTEGNKQMRQMESQSEDVEHRLLSKFGSRIQYTFTQIHGANGGMIMARLKDKSEMRGFWKELEAEFANTPYLRFWVGPWNPSELPIPNPPHMRIAISGSTPEKRHKAAQEINDLLLENKVFPRLWTEPNTSRESSVLVRPNLQQWAALRNLVSFFPLDLADLARVATVGRRVGEISIDGVNTAIQMRYPPGAVETAEDLGALPIGVGGKLVPLKALARVATEEVPPTFYREDERELFVIEGKENKGDESKSGESLARARKLVAEWQAKGASEPGPAVYFEDADKDLSQALKQLGVAIGLSILLMLLTLIMQFGSIGPAILVLVAVPLGFVGVAISLFVFRSTLSLNSALGVILLNGIAVANSIILVDFIRRLVSQGYSPRMAAIEAGRKRLRPILITSLTTILGMLPIALGIGEGGRILQPLGIAVSGGLWVSMSLTLFIVPALQVAYLERKLKREAPAAALSLDASLLSVIEKRVKPETRVTPLASARETSFEGATPNELLQ